MASTARWEIKDFIAKGKPLSQPILSVAFDNIGRGVTMPGSDSKTIVIVRKQDKYTPKLLEHAAKGTMMDIKIEIFQGAGPPVQPSHSSIFHEMIISGFQTSGSGADVRTETITFVWERMERA